MRISDWSSDVCSSDLAKGVITAATAPEHIVPLAMGGSDDASNVRCLCPECHLERTREQFGHRARSTIGEAGGSEEHTSEPQSLMRISYAVFCSNRRRSWQANHSCTD